MDAAGRIGQDQETRAQCLAQPSDGDDLLPAVTLVIMEPAFEEHDTPSAPVGQRHAAFVTCYGRRRQLDHFRERQALANLAALHHRTQS